MFVSKYKSLSLCLVSWLCYGGVLAMASSEEGSSSSKNLDQTPTWAVACVCTVFILISLVLEKVLHKVGAVMSLISHIFSPLAIISTIAPLYLTQNRLWSSVFAQFDWFGTMQFRFPLLRLRHLIISLVQFVILLFCVAHFLFCVCIFQFQFFASWEFFLYFLLKIISYQQLESYKCLGGCFA